MSFISASSYLDGDAFTGMREHMRRVCDEICREEEAMADRLANMLPKVATTYLQRSAAAMEEAKR